MALLSASFPGAAAVLLGDVDGAVPDGHNRSGVVDHKAVVDAWRRADTSNNAAAVVVLLVVKNVARGATVVNRLLLLPMAAFGSERRQRQFFHINFGLRG